MRILQVAWMWSTIETHCVAGRLHIKIWWVHCRFRAEREQHAWNFAAAGLLTNCCRKKIHLNRPVASSQALLSAKEIVACFRLCACVYPVIAVILLVDAQSIKSLGLGPLGGPGWKLMEWHCPLPTLHPFISYLLGLLAGYDQVRYLFLSVWQLLCLQLETCSLLVTSIFAGEVFSWACFGAFMCCAGMALRQWQHTLG